MENGSSMAAISNFSGNHAAGEENARRPEAEVPSPPPAFDAAAYPPSPGLLQPPVAYLPLLPLRWLQLPPCPDACNYNFAIQTNQDLETTRVCSMMTCKQGCHNFAAMVEQCDAERLRILTLLVTSNSSIFLDLAQDQQGSSRQRVLFRRSHHVDDMIFVAVVNHFFLLMTDRYGRYFATRTLEIVDVHRKQQFYQLTESYALALARDSIGCASLKEVITFIRGRYRARILNLLASHAILLSEDSFGPHVIQHMLRLQDTFYTKEIATRLRGHYVRLSQQRLGSYIVERVLESRCWRVVAEEMLTTGVQELPQLANDESGNYVLQMALNVSHANDRGLYERLVSILWPCFGALRVAFTGGRLSS